MGPNILFLIEFVSDDVGKWFGCLRLGALRFSALGMGVRHLLVSGHARSILTSLYVAFGDFRLRFVRLFTLSFKSIPSVETSSAQSDSLHVAHLTDGTLDVSLYHMLLTDALVNWAFWIPHQTLLGYYRIVTFDILFWKHV